MKRRLRWTEDRPNFGAYDAPDPSVGIPDQNDTPEAPQAGKKPSTTTKAPKANKAEKVDEDEAEDDGSGRGLGIMKEFGTIASQK